MSRKAAKPAKEARRVKKTFLLDEDLARKFKCFAARYGFRESEVVAAALENHLVGFKAFGGPGGKPDASEIRLVDRADEPARESA